MTDPKNKLGHPPERTDASTGEDAGFGLDPNASISRKLRDYYGALQEEAIPDRFLDLLERLDAAERKSRPADKT